MQNDPIRQIERTLLVLLPADRPPTEAEVITLANQLRLSFPVSDEDFENLLRRVYAKVSITMDLGTALESEHRPWLSARKPNIEPFYWQRFSKLLSKKDWPPQVIGTLDRVTDEILDMMGNPAQGDHWKRRGLVVGDVQSGKTATYTALTCKAGDAGYRLIILLTGTLENLRRQTQERMDEGFVGLDSSGELTTVRTIRPNRAVGVGLIDATKAAGVFTSRLKDFNKDLLNSLGFRLDAFQIPVLVVMKKNTRILENLERWLAEFNAGSDGKVTAPVLVIDDEADNASINTRKDEEDPAAVNRRIRLLLERFTRSSYVGFTATPFANVFVDPDTNDEMLGNDLFPRDFIYALEAPTNYFGPQAIFGDEPKRDTLRSIEDADGIFPARHKSTLTVESLPNSLLEAARTFLIACTLRDLRGEGMTHRSMLVNVSHFTNVQEQVASLLHTWLSQIQQDIRNYSQLACDEALKIQSVADLKHAWEREYKQSGFSWDQVQVALIDGILPITTKAVNQRSGAASLDFAKHKENGLRVIVVGGNSLSRGLTLEGLSTSYFYRSTKMYDTLMQMGRWFGYRDNYEDLCRVWLTDEAVNWYSHIASATDELRRELKRMRDEGRTPIDFGLRVRAHPGSLLVTAQNKMRKSTLITRVVSISEKSLETTYLKIRDGIIRANRRAVEHFIDEVRSAGVEQSKSTLGNPLWSGIPKSLVAKLLGSFSVDPANITFQARDLAAFIDSANEDFLQTWDVALPQGEGKDSSIQGVTVRRNRRKVRINGDSVLVSGKSARIASRGIEREGIPKEKIEELVRDYKTTNPGKSIPDSLFRLKRPRPLLLIHLIEPTVPDNVEKLPEEIIGLGLSFMKFDDSAVARQVEYRINLVDLRLGEIPEYDIDDESGDEDDLN